MRRLPRPDVQMWLCVTAFMVCALSAPSVMARGEPPLRIMAMGDSITMGAGDMDQGGFRRGLWEGLQARGWEVDMVGRLRNGRGDWDLDHEGWGGRGVGWWRKRAPRVLDMHEPDVVLLMIGTNDIITMRPPEELASHVVDLARDVAEHRPECAVLVSSIPVWVRRPDRSEAFNARLKAGTEGLQLANVHFVDVAGSLTPEDIAPNVHKTGPGLHPNKEGYAKLIQRWLNAIGRHLPGRRRAAGGSERSTAAAGGEGDAHGEQQREQDRATSAR